MRTLNAVNKKATLAVVMLGVLGAAGVSAQAPPPPLPPQQLDQLVGRIALYPDPLLAQILAAATFPDQIPDAARWADQHHYLRGQELANAIQNDHLPWDPSVQALLPFPSVLEMMAGDMNWTSQLGNSFLTQQQEVMDAVQRQRHQAQRYGYLRSNPQIVVGGGPYITIMPVDPGFIPVPYYDPGIVFLRPRDRDFSWEERFASDSGSASAPTSGRGAGEWDSGRFDWGGHRVYINNAPWGRTWINRGAYVHPYEGVHRWGPAERVPEGHELHERSEHERAAPREGRAREEEHGKGRGR